MQPLNPWKQYKAEQQQRRMARRAYWQVELARLRRAGFTVQQLHPDHYRINGEVDFYPVHAQYHNLQNGYRGIIQRNLLGFIRNTCWNNRLYRLNNPMRQRVVKVYLPED